jgi:hypothetical protein
MKRSHHIQLLGIVLLAFATVIVVMATTVVAQETTKKDSGAEQLKRIGAFRDEFATSIKEAAKRANVQLLDGDVAVSVRGDYVIANALIAPPKDVPIEEADRMFFVYLSLPANHPHAKKIPSGFYTIERMPEQKIPRAKVVNLEGKTVLELPLNIRKIEMPPPKWSAPPKDDVSVAQATIEQSQATLYQDTLIQAHRVRCHWSIGVWYWTWV